MLFLSVNSATVATLLQPYLRMKKIKILISLIVIGIYAGNVFAQPQKNLGAKPNYQPIKKNKPDYVILANNDTVLCAVTISLISGKPSYKLLENGAKNIDITPKNVKEYYYGWKDDLYQLIFMSEKNDTIFAKVIEKGKISLFEGYGNPTVVNYGSTMGATREVIWYISKGSNNAEIIKFDNWSAADKERRKSLLEEMVADNKDVADRYAATNKKFTFNHIKHLVHLYNTGVWKD